MRGQLAASLVEVGQKDRAFREADAAESTRAQHLRRTLRYLAEGQALSFAARLPEARDVLLSIVAGARASPAEVLRAFEAMAGSRALVLDEMASRRRASPARAGVDAEIDAVRRRVAHLIYRGADQPGEGQAPALAAAGAELERLERSAAALTADERALASTGSVEAGAPARRPPPRTGLISYGP